MNHLEDNLNIILRLLDIMLDIVDNIEGIDKAVYFLVQVMLVAFDIFDLLFNPSVLFLDGLVGFDDMF